MSNLHMLAVSTNETDISPNKNDFYYNQLIDNNHIMLTPRLKNAFNNINKLENSEYEFRLGVILNNRFFPSLNENFIKECSKTFGKYVLEESTTFSYENNVRKITTKNGGSIFQYKERLKDIDIIILKELDTNKIYAEVFDPTVFKPEIINLRKKEEQDKVLATSEIHSKNIKYNIALQSNNFIQSLIALRFSHSTETPIENFNEHNFKVLSKRSRTRMIFKRDKYEIHLTTVKVDNYITYEIEFEIKNYEDITECFEKFLQDVVKFEMLFYQQTEQIKTISELYRNTSTERENRNLRDVINILVNIKRPKLLSLKSGFSVTNKLDGERFLLISNERGTYLLNDRIFYKISSSSSKFTVLDGELFENTFNIFDSLFINDIDVRNRNHTDRIQLISNDQFDTKLISIKKKNFFIQKPIIRSLLDCIEYMHNFGYDKNDGIVFIPIESKYNTNGYKWKPNDKMSIDFKVIYISTKNNVYTYQLEVSDTIIRNEKKTTITKPFLIKTKEATLTTKEYYDDGTIVECVYVDGKFVPLRTRPDKLYPNALKVALDVFADMLDPITLSELMETLDTEQRVDMFSNESINFFKPNKPKQIEHLEIQVDRTFENMIKERRYSVAFSKILLADVIQPTLQKTITTIKNIIELYHPEDQFDYNYLLTQELFNSTNDMIELSKKLENEENQLIRPSVLRWFLKNININSLSLSNCIEVLANNINVEFNKEMINPLTIEFPDEFYDERYKQVYSDTRKVPTIPEHLKARELIKYVTVGILDNLILKQYKDKSNLLYALKHTSPIEPDNTLTTLMLSCREIIGFDLSNINDFKVFLKSLEINTQKINSLDKLINLLALILCFNQESIKSCLLNWYGDDIDGFIKQIREKPQKNEAIYEVIQLIKKEPSRYIYPISFNRKYKDEILDNYYSDTDKILDIIIDTFMLDGFEEEKPIIEPNYIIRYIAKHRGLLPNIPVNKVENISHIRMDTKRLLFKELKTTIHTELDKYLSKPIEEPVEHREKKLIIKSAEGKQKEEVRPLDTFRTAHSLIKRNLINTYCSNKVALDVGAGVGGDLVKYLISKVKMLYAIEPNKVFYNEFLSRLDKLTIKDETLGIDKRDIMIFKNNVKSLVMSGEDSKGYTKLLGNVKVDVVNLMFSMTFFFKNFEMLNSLITNIGKATKPGSYVVIPTMIGEKLEEQMMSSDIPPFDTPNIKITRLFHPESVHGAYGKSIAISLKTKTVINQEEYLVSQKELKQVLASHGFEVYDESNFDDKIDTSNFSDEEKQLNHHYKYFVFKKVLNSFYINPIKIGEREEYNNNTQLSYQPTTSQKDKTILQAIEAIRDDSELSSVEQMAQIMHLRAQLKEKTTKILRVGTDGSIYSAILIALELKEKKNDFIDKLINKVSIDILEDIGYQRERIVPMIRYRINKYPELLAEFDIQLKTSEPIKALSNALNLLKKTVKKIGAKQIIIDIKDKIVFNFKYELLNELLDEYHLIFISRIINKNIVIVDSAIYKAVQYSNLTELIRPDRDDIMLLKIQNHYEPLSISINNTTTYLTKNSYNQLFK